MSGVQRAWSVEMWTMRPFSTWAFTTQRPPQLWPQVVVTTVSPSREGPRGFW